MAPSPDRRAPNTLCLASLGLIAAACGGAPGPDLDGGAPDAGTVAAPPAPPVLTPCPEGWREVTDAHGVTTCDPYPAEGYRGADCAWDEAHFVGTPGCARVGSACPVDGWPADLPSDRTIVYVDDDAASGGDGASRETAYARIGDAVGRAPAGAVIAVAVGRYDEPVRLSRPGTTLWGACVDGTRLTTTTPWETGGELMLAADGTGARNLGIDTPERIGVYVTGGADVHLDGVVVEGASRTGFAVAGGTVVASDLVVRGTRELADGTKGTGLLVQGASSLTLRRALIGDNREAAIVLSGTGARLEASDVVVRGTRERSADRKFGRGIDLQAGASLSLARVLIEDNRDIGLLAVDAGSRVEAVDLLVRSTRERSYDGTGGRGVGSAEGAWVTLSRAVIGDNRDVGVYAFGGGALLEVSDLVVRGTRERTVDGVGGRGLVAEAGASVVVSRAVIDDSRDAGLASLREGTRLEASDLVVRGTRERAHDGLFGRGIAVQEYAALVLSRALAVDNREVGIWAGGGGASLEARDVAVLDTAPRRADGAYGGGIVVQDATTTLSGVVVERAYMAGIVSGRRATIQGSRILVRDVRESTCNTLMEPGCSETWGGHGLLVQYAGSLSMSDFTVEAATLCGVLISEDDFYGEASLDLANGTVSRTAIGACLQQASFDPRRVSSSVRYVDVGIPLQATSFSLPDALAAGS